MAIDTEAFRRARAQSGLSQKSLADRSGVSQQLIGAIESGRVRSTKHLLRISSALNTHLSLLDPDTIDLGFDPGHPLKAAQYEQTIPIFATKTIQYDRHYRQFRSLVPASSTPRLSSALAGFWVWTDDMEPRIRRGDLVLIDEHRPWRRGADVVLGRQFQDHLLGLDGQFMSNSGHVAEVLIRNLVDYDADTWIVATLASSERQVLRRDEWPEINPIVGVLLA